MKSKIRKMIVELGSKTGKKAINSDCDYYLYKEPISENLKKYQKTTKKDQ